MGPPSNIYLFTMCLLWKINLVKLYHYPTECRHLKSSNWYQLLRPHAHKKMDSIGPHPGSAFLLDVGYNCKSNWDNWSGLSDSAGWVQSDRGLFLSLGPWKLAMAICEIGIYSYLICIKDTEICVINMTIHIGHISRIHLVTHSILGVHNKNSNP